MLFFKILLMFVFVFSLMGISGSYSEDLFCRQTQCKFYGNYPTWNSNPCKINNKNTLNLKKIKSKRENNTLTWKDKFKYTQCAMEMDCEGSYSHSEYSFNVNSKLLTILTRGNYGGKYGPFNMNRKLMCEEIKKNILMYSKKDKINYDNKLKTDIISKVDLVHYNEIKEVNLQIDLDLYSTLVALHFTPPWKKNLIHFQGRIILFNEVCNLYGVFKKMEKNGKIDIKCRLSNYSLSSSIKNYNSYIISGSGKDSFGSFIKLAIKIQNSKKINKDDFVFAIKNKKDFYNDKKLPNQTNKEIEKKIIKEESKDKDF